jgi:ABC-type multidrug transport system ATPase subunit
MATPLIAARAASLIIGGRHILDDIDLSAQVGEWVSIVGANEAGKTSLLHLFAGWRAPTSGGITFQDRPLQPDDRVTIVLAPGQDDLPGHLLGKELLDLVTHERRAQEPQDWPNILQALDGHRWLDRPISELSLGTKRKVALATALCSSPKVLLLDEAFDALDAHSSVRIRTMVRRLVLERKMTVISASHAWESVFTDSDQIAFLSAGKIVRSLTRAQFEDLARQSEAMQATILEAFALPAQPTK